MAVKIWNGATDDDWTNTGNWVGGVIPVNGDDVYIKQADNSILTNLDQSSLSLTSLHITQAFNLQVGDDTESLKLDVDNVFIGSSADGNNGSAQYIGLEFVTSNTTIDVINSNSSGVDFNNSKQFGQNVQITDFGSGTIDLIVRRGTVGALINAGATGTLNSLTTYGGKTVVGEGCTVTTIEEVGGDIDCYDDAITATLKGGTFNLFLGANITTLNLENGCQFISQGNGTITTLNANGGIGRLLYKGLTVTTVVAGRGANLDIDVDLVTITNEIDIASGSVILNMEF